MLQFIAVMPFGLLKLFQPFNYQASVIRNWQLNQRNLQKKYPLFWAETVYLFHTAATLLFAKIKIKI